MKKMYFAMVPEGGKLDDVLTVIGVGAAVYFGAKYLLGDDKLNEYKRKIKNLSFLSAPKPAAQGPDTGMGLNEEDAKAKEEENILERIRKAAQKI